MKQGASHVVIDRYQSVMVGHSHFFMLELGGPVVLNRVSYTSGCISGDVVLQYHRIQNGKCQHSFSWERHIVERNLASSYMEAETVYSSPETAPANTALGPLPALPVPHPADGVLLKPKEDTLHVKQIKRLPSNTVHLFVTQSILMFEILQT